MAERAPHATFDLATLLAPRSVDDFLGSAWQRSPLYLRRDDPHRYASILTEEQLEEWLNAADVRYPALQLARDGAYLAPELYTRSTRHGAETFSGVIDLERVRAEYRTGATIVLPALHRAWKPLRAACEALEDELSHAVHANAYLTPGRAAGFTPHYDTHDVFVLQIAGHKHWRVHAPPLALPHHTQPFSPAGYAPGAPLLDIDLRPGDLLYLPRGYVHSAATSDERSLHVTVGVTMFTWVELLIEVLQAAKAVPALREALPVGFARRPELHARMAFDLVAHLNALATHAEPEALIGAFLQRVRASRARPAHPFSTNVVVTEWRSLLEAPPADRFRIATQDGVTTLEHEGRTLRLPAGVRPTLDAIAARGRFRPADLPRDLDEHATLAFVRFLEGEGFLRHVRTP